MIFLKEWVKHYNEDRPHMSLGLGIPQPSFELPASRQAHAHHIRVGWQVRSRSVLAGLHHHYELEQGRMIMNVTLGGTESIRYKPDIFPTTIEMSL
jgi:hypothetical protein